MSEFSNRIIRPLKAPAAQAMPLTRMEVIRLNTDSMDLNLRSLDVFVQIAESGAMTSIAKRMGLTQSAVSQMVSNLEQSLGVQLFDRQVRPLALTPSGVVLLDGARSLLASAREAVQAARQPLAISFPRLNLCVVESVAATIGPQLFEDIQSHAEFWSIQRGLHINHSRALATRETDVIVSADSIDGSFNFEHHEVLKEPFILAVPAALETKPQSLASLAHDANLIKFSARTVLGRLTDRHLRRLQVTVTSHFEFDSPDAVLSLVASGRGWAIVTPLAALGARQFLPRLSFAPLPTPAFYRRINVIARQGELGQLPVRIADAAGCLIAKLFEAGLAETYPWMIEESIIRTAG